MRPNPLPACVLACAALLAVPASAQRKLTTLFTSNNGGSSGWTVFFDANVTSATGIWITALEVNVSSAVHVPFTIDVYRTPGSYVGNDGSQGAWTRLATGEGNSAGRNVPSTVTFALPIPLAAGSHGIALYHLGGSPAYTDGNGNNQNYANADLALALGLVRAGQFTGTVFTPRVWNGSIWYDVRPDPPSFVTYGSGCAGSNGTPAVSAAQNSAPRVGTTFMLGFANLPATPGPFPLLLGASRTGWGALVLPFDVGVLGLTGCRLYASGELSLTAINTGGSGFAPVPIPNAPSLVGARLYVQGLVRDPAANRFGATLSNAGQLLIGT
jgi:hypothetical protein